ncbi:hypothetical protein TNCV_3380601 [Trichonephila clavipes]|nr:hypothetical protein TNCV_3380601 [Trichonephila clavipes]
MDLDFLHHRSIRVKFNFTFSDPVVLGQVFPQGSVLSPTLFSLYLAGIEKPPSVETRVGLFADDIAIWCLGRDLVEMERNLTMHYLLFLTILWSSNFVFILQSPSLLSLPPTKDCTAINQP